MSENADRIFGDSLEHARRRLESLRLYEPSETQEAAHESKTKQRLVIGDNRAGKTLFGAVECARACLGRDPHGKFPTTDLKVRALGPTLQHIGMVLYPKLFRAGAFRIIRDPETLLWRAFKPWQEWDAAYVEKSKPAPPLITQHHIKEIAWENKKEDVPSLVRFHNGSELIFHSSEGKPQQGDSFHVAWIDEEILNRVWYQELCRGLVDYGISLFWTATPQEATEQLYILHRQAERAQREGRKPRVEEFLLRLADNKHIAQEAREEFIESLEGDEEQIAVRVGGTFAVESRKVFPEFSFGIHAVKDFPIPPHWTKYASVDPGYQRCAILYFAVPPEHEDESVYVFDESYLSNCDAKKFAEEMQRKTSGMIFQAFLIDSRSARTRDLGSGKQLQQWYSEALAQQKVESVLTGSNFLWGTTDVEGSIEAVRGMLRIQTNGKPKLRVFQGTTHNLRWEIERWLRVRKKTGGASHMTDKPMNGDDHLADCLRFGCAHGLPYVKPPVRKTGHGIAALVARKKKKQQVASASYISMGPLT